MLYILNVQIVLRENLEIHKHSDIRLQLVELVKPMFE